MEFDAYPELLSDLGNIRIGMDFQKAPNGNVWCYIPASDRFWLRALHRDEVLFPLQP
jgi:hypothetical protein